MTPTRCVTLSSLSGLGSKLEEADRLLIASCVVLQDDYLNVSVIGNGTKVWVLARMTWEEWQKVPNSSQRFLDAIGPNMMDPLDESHERLPTKTKTEKARMRKPTLEQHSRLMASFFVSVPVSAGDLIFNPMPGTHQVDSNRGTLAGSAFYQKT